MLHRCCFLIFVAHATSGLRDWDDDCMPVPYDLEAKVVKEEFHHKILDYIVGLDLDELKKVLQRRPREAHFRDTTDLPHPLLLASQIQGPTGAALCDALYVSGIDPRTTFQDGTTVLHNAAVAHAMEALETSLRHGTCRNVVDKNGYTALAYAVMLNDVDVVDMLLKHGSSPNVPLTYEEITASHLALDTPYNTKMLKMLIAGGADLGHEIMNTALGRKEILLGWGTHRLEVEASRVISKGMVEGARLGYQYPGSLSILLETTKNVFDVHVIRDLIQVEMIKKDGDICWQCDGDGRSVIWYLVRNGMYISANEVLDIYSHVVMNRSPGYRFCTPNDADQHGITPLTLLLGEFKSSDPLVDKNTKPNAIARLKLWRRLLEWRNPLHGSPALAGVVMANEGGVGQMALLTHLQAAAAYPMLERLTNVHHDINDPQEGRYDNILLRIVMESEFASDVFPYISVFGLSIERDYTAAVELILSQVLPKMKDQSILWEWVVISYERHAWAALRRIIRESNLDFTPWFMRSEIEDADLWLKIFPLLPYTFQFSKPSNFICPILHALHITYSAPNFPDKRGVELIHMLMSPAWRPRAFTCATEVATFIRATSAQVDIFRAMVLWEDMKTPFKHAVAYGTLNEAESAKAELIFPILALILGVWVQRIYPMIRVNFYGRRTPTFLMFIQGSAFLPLPQYRLKNYPKIKGIKTNAFKEFIGMGPTRNPLKLTGAIIVSICLYHDKNSVAGLVILFLHALSVSAYIFVTMGYILPKLSDTWQAYQFVSTGVNFKASDPPKGPDNYPDDAPGPGSHLHDPPSPGGVRLGYAVKKDVPEPFLDTIHDDVFPAGEIPEFNSEPDGWGLEEDEWGYWDKKQEELERAKWRNARNWRLTHLKDWEVVSEKEDETVNEDMPSEPRQRLPWERREGEEAEEDVDVDVEDGKPDIYEVYKRETPSDKSWMKMGPGYVAPPTPNTDSDTPVEEEDEDASSIRSLFTVSSLTTNEGLDPLGDAMRIRWERIQESWYQGSLRTYALIIFSICVVLYPLALSRSIFIGAWPLNWNTTEPPGTIHDLVIDVYILVLIAECLLHLVTPIGVLIQMLVLRGYILELLCEMSEGLVYSDDLFTDLRLYTRTRDMLLRPQVEDWHTASPRVSQFTQLTTGVCATLAACGSFALHIRGPDMLLNCVIGACVFMLFWITRLLSCVKHTNQKFREAQTRAARAAKKIQRPGISLRGITYL